jgi:hypothetical protein
MKLAALALLAFACPLTGQAAEKAGPPVFPHSALVQPSHAMCVAWEPWLEQARLRSSGDDELWFATLRPLILKGTCQLTRGGEPLRFINEMAYTSDRAFWAFLVADPDGFVWYIAPEAYDP